MCYTAGKLELKFAKQKSTPIVPVMLQGGGWRPDEWLGLVVAGALWTPLHDPNSFDQNLTSLVEQIKSAASTTMVDANAVDTTITEPAAAGESEDVTVLRTELDGLRKDLVAMSRATTSNPQAAIAGASALAPVPAEVPQLSLNLQPTPDMQTLKSMLISSDAYDSKMSVTSEKSKIGAMGE